MDASYKNILFYQSSESDVENMIFISIKTQEEKEDITKMLNLLNKEFLVLERSWLQNLKLIRSYNQKKISLILGSPSLKNRVLAKIFNIKFVAYLRNLHPDSNKLTSIPDWVNFYLTKIGIKFNTINPYFADGFLITSEVTNQFLQKRDVINDNVTNIGSIWLNDIKSSTNKIDSDIIFFSQSFKEHGYYSAAREQIDLLKKVIEDSEKVGKKVLLRKHPRDDFNYESKFKKLSIDSSKPSDFLRRISNKNICISPYSTFIFEIMYLGAKIIPIGYQSTEDLNKCFKDAGIDYVFPSDLNLQTIEVNKNYKNALDEFNYDLLKKSLYELLN